MKNKIKRKVRLFFKGGLAFLCGGWRNLLEQWSGLLEEVGVLLEKEAAQTVFLIRKDVERRPGLILLEQLKGILEEVGVLLESLGSLLENRRSPWQEVCSFSYIRAGEEGHRVLLEQLCRLLEKGGRY